MHQSGKYGVILNLSTDQTADDADLSLIGQKIAMQIAAMNPKYIARERIQPAALKAFKAAG